MQRKFRILGCSSSPGVPRITGEWGACDPTNPKNRRTRASLLIEQMDDVGKKTVVVIDTGPDFHQQMVTAHASQLDAVVLTHAHADHLHGIDDVRSYVYANNHRMPVWADRETMDRVLQGFGYCFETPPSSSYPPITRAFPFERDIKSFDILGPGGSISFQPIFLDHGESHSVGYRVGDFAYCTDVSYFPDEALEKLTDLDVLVIDCLQYRTHPSHLSLKQSLEWIEKIAPKRAILTHMHIPLDYETVRLETPDHVEPAFDGLEVIYQL